MIRAAQPGLTSQALLLGELSSALLCSCLLSHMDSWSTSSSSAPLDDLMLGLLSFDRAGAAEQEETQHLLRAGGCFCHLLTQNASSTGPSPLGHPHPGPLVPTAGRQWEVNSDSDSRRFLGLTQTLEQGSWGILPE